MSLKYSDMPGVRSERGREGGRGGGSRSGSGKGATTVLRIRAAWRTHSSAPNLSLRQQCPRRPWRQGLGSTALSQCSAVLPRPEWQLPRRWRARVIGTGPARTRRPHTFEAELQQPVSHRHFPPLHCDSSRASNSEGFAGSDEWAEGGSEKLGRREGGGWG